MIRRRIPFVAFVSLLCAVLISMIGCRHEAESTYRLQQTPNIKVETVHTEKVSDVLEVPGRVEVDPVHQVHIYAPLSGRLLEVRLSPGQEVRKGQTVAICKVGTSLRPERSSRSLVSKLLAPIGLWREGSCSLRMRCFRKRISRS